MSVTNHPGLRRLTLTRTFAWRIVIVWTFALVCASVIAQSQPIQIVPAPKSVETGSGTFAIDRRTRVVLAESKSVEDRFAAQDFIDDLKATGGVTLAIGGGKSHAIFIGELDKPTFAELVK